MYLVRSTKHTSPLPRQGTNQRLTISGIHVKNFLLHPEAFFYVIRLGLNVALTYRTRSYRDSETNNRGTEKEVERGNDRKRTLLLLLGLNVALTHQN